MSARALRLGVVSGVIDTMNPIARFLQNEEAATAVEYSVMLALILLVILAAIGSVGGKTGGMWSGIFSRIQAAGM
jgi:pilus assembly protein Flp/PilA